MVKDGTLDICNELLKDKAYADAVDIVGLHYPSDFADFSVTWQLILPPPVLSPPQRAVKTEKMLHLLCCLLSSKPELESRGLLVARVLLHFSYQ